MALNDNAIDRAYEQLLMVPSVENYLAARRIVLSQLGWVRNAEDLRRLEQWTRGRNLAAALDHAAGMIPAWLLCPRLHYLLASVAIDSDDLETHELERFQFQACLQGILNTGDGSQRHPYRVVDTSDIRDVVCALGREVRGQQCRPFGPSLVDVITCSDGTELFFDRSDEMQSQQERVAHTPMSLRN